MSDRQGLSRREFLVALSGAALAAPALNRCSTATVMARDVHWTSVQAMIDSYVGEGRLPGAAAALSFQGSPLAYPSAGRIALDSATPFDENSICRIYSMSKPVTGAAAMMLIEEGRMSLDQPVEDVITEFRSMRVGIDLANGLESRAPMKAMTMRHLLTHTSGLEYWTPRAGASRLPALYRERGITPGNYGTRLQRPGYGR